MKYEEHEKLKKWPKIQNLQSAQGTGVVQMQNLRKDLKTFCPRAFEGLDLHTSKC